MEQPGQRRGLDFAALRARLQQPQRRYWRSVAELAETPAAQEALEREFPEGASEWPVGVDRRSFLKRMAACLALAGVNGCTKPILKEIVPYVEQPERIVFGKPLYFATAMPLGGFGTGMLVKSREGRPIKADGNPKHPASLGGSSVWLQACLLDLYDPDRAQSVSHLGKPNSWGLFIDALSEALQPQQKTGGTGLRLLTGTVTSPTLAALLQRVLLKFPEARWHQYEPVNRDNASAGAQLAFGQCLATHYDLTKAAVILSLDSDFIYAHPERLRYARHFADARRVVTGGPVMNRFYALESTPSVTGSMADHRLPLSSAELQAASAYLAQAFGLPCSVNAARLPEPGRRWLDQALADLRQHQGRCLVTVGEFQPPLMQELEHRLNEQLGNIGRTVHYSDPAEFRPVMQVQSLRELVTAMDKGQVELLLIVGGNPVYDAPLDFQFEQALSQVRQTAHLSLSFNETSERCVWHVPQTHFLETWGDIRSFDGTVTIQQPLIAPLFGGHSEFELLSLLEQLQPPRTGYELVREHWAQQGKWQDFEQGWREAVQDGVVQGTRSPERQVPLRPPQQLTPEITTSEPGAGPLEILFRPDPNLWDGRFAANAWLQEMPKPITRLSWDNAVLISPRLAERQKVSNGDVVELRFQGRWLRAAAWILPGQADRCVTVHLGYGRQQAGVVGTGAGFNAFYLRFSNALWQAPGLGLTKSEGHYEFATPQVHRRLHDPERQVYREGTLAQFVANPMFVKESIEVPDKQDTLYYPHQYDYPLKWGMAIDLSTCIGCNACSMACNMENNIPVVGKEQVAMGREMLWIRVDTYYHGSLDNPEFKNQPVPCMQCENAPCEYVCPVDATLHDHEGLNLQVYNRCIGTRYCSNNCPYKVRRFNFLGYTTFTTPLEALRNNPEVSVRSRGVMEKCTYCVQRIAAARIKAGEENRAIREGEVKTACQEACPTGTIVFGIMTDDSSPVSQYKRHALEYPMLGQENTRPRTTYLAKLQNPNPSLA
jgi:MoCo/4Fe-4S cofactor protein with predicted Tat translocation signal